MSKGAKPLEQASPTDSGGTRKFSGRATNPPPRGFSIEEAVQKWVGVGLTGDAALDRLIEDLRAGTVLASGISKIEERDDYRKIIHPSLWDSLLIYPDFNEIGWDQRTYLYPEFFEPELIPLNVTHRPDWLGIYIDRTRGVSSTGFEHDADYGHVAVGGQEFTLGLMQAGVIRKLHEVSATDSPWLVGKVIMSEIGARSSSIHQLFKKKENWEKLIESDGRGRYRLTVDSSKR